MQHGLRFVPMNKRLPHLPIALLARGAHDAQKWIGLGAVGLITGLLCAPFLRTIVRFGDEGVLLNGADRILRGERLYVDFFEFLPPGGFLLVAGWLSATGISHASARALAILVIVGIACTTYLTCLRVSRSAAVSASVVLCWIVMSQGWWTQVNHHWFTTLFCMMAFMALLIWIEQSEKIRWLIVAGLAGGAAAMITPTRGALALLAGIVGIIGARRPFAAFAIYSTSAAVVPSLLVLHVGADGALGAAFESVIIYTATNYASVQSVPYGAFSNPQNAQLQLLFPAAALAAALCVARDWRAAASDRVLHVCIAFGLAGAVGFLVRPDIAHIAFAAPLVIPLLLYSSSKLDFQSSRKLLPGIVAVAALLLLLPAWAFVTQALHAMQSPSVVSPRGNIRLALPETGMGDIIRRVEALPSGDTVFFYPYSPLAAFVTARIHPARFDIFVPTYTTASQFREACISVLRRANWMVIDRWRMETWQEQGFPGMRDPAPPERLRFETALEGASTFVARDVDFELRRVTGGSDAACYHIDQK